MRNEFDSPFDKGIRKAVEILSEAGIETYESCEGGSGHSYPELPFAFMENKVKVFGY